MQGDKDDQETRAVMVQAADEASRRGADDETDTVVGVVRRRCVVERQERPGEELDAEEREEHAAQGKEPSSAGREFLVEQNVPRRAKPGPRVQPVGQAWAPGPWRRRRFHSLTRTAPSSFAIRASRRSSGRGGGPSTTF